MAGTSVNFSGIVGGLLTWDVQMSISTKIWAETNAYLVRVTHFNCSRPSYATQDAQTSPRNADDKGSVSVMECG